MTSAAPTEPSAAPPPPQRLLQLFPGLLALRQISTATLAADALAAITLAAYMIPSAIGDATLARLPPEAGLYACLGAGLVFWLFCSSRHTAVTVTSAISLLIGSSIADVAGGDASAALAAAAALLVSLFALLAWLLRAGVLVNFISETVLVGFKTGVALQLASTQLPKLFGYKGSHGDFFERAWYFIVHLKETNPVALLVGGAALLILILGKIFLPTKPVALFTMIAGIIVASVAHLDTYGVNLLGKIPPGIPHPALPEITFADVNNLLPLALAAFLLASVETAAIGRTFALKHGYRLNSNQDFLAIAAANLAAGLTHGLPVSGGMSQSVVNESAGARTALSTFLAAVVILIVTLFFSGLLRTLPDPVLAAIVLVAVAGLVQGAALRRLWHFGQGEFAVAMAAFLGVLAFDLLRGVLIGAALSILMLLRRGSRPHVTELGCVPNSHFFADCIRHPENLRVPGVFVFRADGALLYFNVEHVRDRFNDLLALRPDPIRLAIFHLGDVAMIDHAGAELLTSLCHDLHTRGITFRLAEAHSGLREALRRSDFIDVYGPVTANQTVHQTIAQLAATASVAAAQNSSFLGDSAG